LENITFFLQSYRAPSIVTAWLVESVELDGLLMTPIKDRVGVELSSRVHSIAS
jgi:hypothetical protein